MDTKDLKLFAQCYVEAQEPKEKDIESLFTFIEKANDHQLINFMMTGEPRFVSETDSYNSRMAFQESGLPILLTEFAPVIYSSGQGIPEGLAKMLFDLSQKATGIKPLATIGSARRFLSKADASQVMDMASYLLAGAAGASALLLTAIIAFLLKKIANRTLSKAARACKGLKGKDKTKCMYKFEVEIVKNQVAALKKLMGACSKNKSPEVCKAKINARMTGLKSKIERLKHKGKVE